MNINYNTILYNKADDNHIIYYVVKNYDGSTLSIEQLKEYQQQDNDTLYNLNELRQNNKLNIVYYGCGCYDKKQEDEGHHITSWAKITNWIEM